jgi:zinc protease
MNFRRSIWIISVLAVLASSAAQSQDSHKPEGGKVERKNRAPVSKDVLKVSLPKATESVLSNGVTVMIMEDHRLPLVSIQYNISAAGPLFEPADMPGLANIAAQMMDEGTQTRTSRQSAEAVESLGASLSVSSRFGSSATIVTASGLSDNFDDWFALANDVLLNPSFPADELERLKQRLRITLRQQRTDPDFLSNERFSRAVYGDHPASNVAPTLAAIDKLTPEMLAKWHDDRLAPQNAILGITGDVRAADLLPKLEKALASWKRTDLKEMLPENPKPVSARKVYLVNRPASEQTSLALGNIAIERRSPDYFPFLVTNQVFGGNGSARLFSNLREEKGYTYGAYSTFAAVKYPGAWYAYGDVRTAVTDPAMTEFLKEITRIRDESVTEKELEDSKRSIVASFALSLEDKTQLLNYQITRKVYELPADYWDTYPARINAVTIADVQRVARAYINPESIQIVAVGDASKIRTSLGKYGPVETYDIDGKKTGK